jgi:hypothetical protein
MSHRMLRFRSALGLVVGAVNLDVAAYFRAVTILGGFVTVLLLAAAGLTATGLAINVADAYLPLRTSTTTVSHVLPPNTFEPANRPYGIWTADEVSYELSTDPKVAPGAPVTIYSRAVSHRFAGIRVGSTYFAGAPISERQSETYLVVTGLIGLMALVLLTLTLANFRNWRAVERDLQAQLVSRRGRVLGMPLSWLGMYAQTLIEGVGMPLIMVDAQTGQRFALGVPVRAIDVMEPIQARLVETGEEVIAFFYPNTKVMSRLRRPDRDAAPVEAAA